MAQDYDVSLKLLFHHSRGLVAQRLFGGPVVEWVDIEQPKVTKYPRGLAGPSGRRVASPC